MELSPQSVSSTTFKIVKKGYDPDEVRAYLSRLASSIETTQNQATAMEARARAAVVRLQEIAAQPPQQAAQGAPASVTDESEMISRTLLLAQRTADSTVADANAEAQRVSDAANTEAHNVVAAAQELAGRLIEEAKLEARRAGEGQRVQCESQVQALLARREFLLSDVEHLEQHTVTQRERLREVAGSLTDLIDRVPGGLGDLRRPLVSAAGDGEPPTPTEDSEPEPAFGELADEAESTDSPSAIRGLGFDPFRATTPMAPGDAAVVGPMTSPEPVVLTTMVEPDSDPVESSQPTSAGEATPPSGSSNQFLFEDITEEVPRITPPSAHDDNLKIHGDEM